MLVYVGIGKEDVPGDCEWLAGKLADLRIFPDEDYKMNLSVRDMGGSILVVSQFTLYADARKGRRPSYSLAATPDAARALYEDFIVRLGHGPPDRDGEYQAVMDVTYTNKGPVTILLDTEKSV
ncbi:MAG: D-aminoacyl-tRNA deacylase [Desulfomicrobium escambiense]|nr:D-aminoacyl-tRNA deacylase [Desulfomicrobium escambiense]